MLVVAGAALAGLVHVVSGPDHLAAVAPFAVGGQRGIWRVGLRWGLGHAAGTLAVGALALLARGALPLETLGAWSERLVGVVLIAVGLWAVRSMLRNRIHSHPHAHDDEDVHHDHVHAHPGGADAHAHDDLVHRHEHSALGIGLLHGVAGGSHLIGVLPALALGTTGAAAGYVLAFGAGGVLGMTAWAAVIGWLGRRTNDVARAHRVLGWGAAVAAIAVGIVWLGTPVG